MLINEFRVQLNEAFDMKTDFLINIHKYLKPIKDETKQIELTKASTYCLTFDKNPVKFLFKVLKDFSQNDRIF